MLDILKETHKPLLIHGEKLADNIHLFDREKYFIDDETNIETEFTFNQLNLDSVFPNILEPLCSFLSSFCLLLTYNL